MGNSGDYIDRQVRGAVGGGGRRKGEGGGGKGREGEKGRKEPMGLVCDFLLLLARLAGQQAESHPQGPTHVHCCVHAPDKVRASRVQWPGGERFFFML